MKFANLGIAVVAVLVLLSLSAFGQSTVNNRVSAPAQTPVSPAMSAPGSPAAQPPSGSSPTAPAAPAKPGSGATQPAAAAQPASGTILVGNGDLLDISMYGVPDFKAEARVSSTGEVDVPMVGPVHVTGMTSEQAAHAIAAELKNRGFFNDPHIAVLQKEYATQGISVLGEVQKPGIYPFPGSRKLFDTISVAGGTTQKAARKVIVTHRNDPQHPITVEMSNDPAEAMASNVDVFPGDTVMVARAGIVYVVGDVKLPGGFVMDNSQLTVLQAVALAQGTNPDAALNSAKLIRRTTAGPQEIPIELKKILSAKAPDLKLEAEDIVFVPASAGRGAARRGLEAILQTATGLAIYHPY